MDTTGLLPGLVGAQHGSRHPTPRRAGQLSWLGRVATLCVGMVAMATAVASPTAAAQATSSTDRAAGAVNATGGRVSQAPVTEAVDYVALGDSYANAGFGHGALWLIAAVAAALTGAEAWAHSDAADRLARLLCQDADVAWRRLDDECSDPSGDRCGGVGVR